jgi:hypothetical protein
VLDTITTVLVAILGIHALVKFAFFTLSYRRRRAALDKSYNGKRCATRRSDLSVLICLSLAFLV